MEIFGKTEFIQIKCVDVQLLNKEVLISYLTRNSPNNLDAQLASYESELSSILNRHAPIKRALIAFRQPGRGISITSSQSKKSGGK